MKEKELTKEELKKRCDEMGIPKFIREHRLKPD